MFGIGLGELILIVLLALVILGPHESVNTLKKIAMFIKTIGRYKEEVKTSIEKSIHE